MVSERPRRGRSSPELVVRDEQGALHLVGGYSPTSDAYHFPLSGVCPYSGAEDVERRLLSPDGTLWGWTAVTAAPPGYAGPVPYGFGIVELPEGLRVITRLTEADPTLLAFGQPVHLVAETIETPDGESLETYAFAS